MYQSSVAIVEILSTGVTGRIIPEAASSRVPEVLPTYSAMLARLSPKEVEILNSLYHMATSQEYLQEGEIPFGTDTDDTGVDANMAGMYDGNFVALGISGYGPATMSARALRQMADSLKEVETTGPDIRGIASWTNSWTST